MNQIYERNFLYIKPLQQEKIKNTRILFGGVGLGSVIAETALRLGFENFTFIDADEVEASNLNRQNYLHQDVGIPKVEALTNRLKAINPAVNITYHQDFLNENNTHQYLQNCDIAINAIDFSTSAPFVFDNACKKLHIPVIHPHNFGWAGGAYVVKPESSQIDSFSNNQAEFEYKMAMHIIKQSKESLYLDWLDEFVDEFMEERLKNPLLSPSQLSIGANLVAGIVGNLLFFLANNLPVKLFPDFYFLSTR